MNVRLVPAIGDKCRICGTARFLAFRDTEMSGAGVCPDCIDALCLADRVLEKFMARPGKQAA